MSRRRPSLGINPVLEEQTTAEVKDYLDILDRVTGGRHADNSFAEAVLRPMVSGKDAGLKRKPRERVVHSDPLITKKSDQVIEVTVVYDDKHHYKALESKESFDIETKKLPMTRGFRRPMNIRDMLKEEWIDQRAVDGLQSHTFHTLIVTTVDPTTKEPMYSTRYEHECLKLMVWEVKPEKEALLRVEMDKFKGTMRSIDTVEDIFGIGEATVEVPRDGGKNVLLHWGSSKFVVCSEEASDCEFLRENFTHKADVAFLPRMAMDYIHSDNKSYVHYMLFKRPVAKDQYSFVSRVSPKGYEGLKYQTGMGCGIVFLLVATNPVYADNAATKAPFCMPQHPQQFKNTRSGAHILVIDEDGVVWLQEANFTNTNGMTLGPNLIWTAGTKNGTLIQDLNSLAQWEDVEPLL